MLKKPKPLHRKVIRTSAKILFIAEALLFAGSYAVWYRLNHYRDFRYYMRENYPSILEGYYKVGETVDSNNQIRKIDAEIWAYKGSK